MFEQLFSENASVSICLDPEFYFIVFYIQNYYFNDFSIRGSDDYFFCGLSR